MDGNDVLARVDIEVARHAFKRFHPHHVSQLDSIVIVGKRDTGKTFLIQHLIPYLQCHHVAIIGIHRSPFEYKHIIPADHITTEYSEKAVEDFIARQKENDGTKNGCIIFEDCIYDENWVERPTMHTLFTNGRSLRAKTVIAMQFPLSLPKQFLENVDYVFIFREQLVGNRKRIHKLCGSVFPTFELLCEAIDEIMKIPFACMVINTVKSNKIEDKVMIYVASEEPDWRIMVEKKTESLNVFREELMQRAWHPKRLRQCLDIHEVREIFGES